MHWAPTGHPLRSRGRMHPVVGCHVPDLPARSQLKTTEEFEQARQAYKRRTSQAMNGLGPCYVEVTYNDDPPRWSTLKDVHDRARHMDKAGMLLIEHRPTDQKPQWLCLTRLTTALDAPRATSMLDLFTRFYVRQILTKRSPSHGWKAAQRKAKNVNRIPILVTAVHGTRTGTCLAPLHWHLNREASHA